MKRLRGRVQVGCQLKHRDLQSLSSFLLDLHAATDLHTFGSAVVQGLRRLVPADRCSLNYLDPLTGQATWVADGGEYPMTKRVFAAHISDHPILLHVRRTGDPSCLRLSDHTTSQAFHRSALYNDWYRPLGTEHQLMTLFPDAKDRFVAVALSRGGRRDFSDRERLLGTVVIPHLMAGYRVALRASPFSKRLRY